MKPAAIRFARRLVRRAISAVYPPAFIDRIVFPQAEAARGRTVRNVQVIHPAERVRVAQPGADPFLAVAKHYRDGCFDRPDVFVCELPGGYVHVPTGMTCTSESKVVMDIGLEHRRFNYPLFYKPRPLRVRRIAGACSSIIPCYQFNFWHWLVDGLPRVQLLEQAMKGKALTLVVPSSLNDYQRVTLECVTPPNFRIEYVDGDEWVSGDQLLWASLLAQLAIGFLPKRYYEAIRQPVFKRFGLPETHMKTQRIYVSRAGAQHRKITNEEAFCRLIEPYGFKRVLLEQLSFRQQVELFHCAEIVIGPHGAGLGTMLFAGDAHMVALYPNREPPNYFHSLACGLGQKHDFVCHDEPGEDDSFAANLPSVQRILEESLRLKPGHSTS